MYNNNQTVSVALDLIEKVTNEPIVKNWIKDWATNDPKAMRNIRVEFNADLEQIYFHDSACNYVVYVMDY